jgi:hypothetical protein
MYVRATYICMYIPSCYALHNSVLILAIFINVVQYAIEPYKG